MQHMPSPYMRRYRIPHLGFRIDDAPPLAASSSSFELMPPAAPPRHYWCHEAGDTAGFMRYEEAEQLLSPIEIQSKLELIHMKNRKLLRFHSASGKAELNNNNNDISNRDNSVQLTENPTCRFPFSPGNHLPSSSSFVIAGNPAGRPLLPSPGTGRIVNAVPRESPKSHLKSSPTRCGEAEVKNGLRSLTIADLSKPSVVTNVFEPDETSERARERSCRRQVRYRKSRAHLTSSSKDGVMVRSSSIRRTPSSSASSIFKSSSSSSASSFSSFSATSSNDFTTALDRRTSSTLLEKNGRTSATQALASAAKNEAEEAKLERAPTLSGSASIWQRRPDTRRAISAGPPPLLPPPPLPLHIGVSATSRRRNILDGNANRVCLRQ